MIAFVLGSGGVPGAVEVGMLQALHEAGVRADLIVGTSVGAINGAVAAADPDAAQLERLASMWSALGRDDIFGGGVLRKAATLARHRTHLHGSHTLRGLIERQAGRDFGELAIRFECVAACVETARAQWFSSGPLVEPVLASCSVPGLLPPVEIDGLHYVDGGLVDGIPLGRAVALGATEIYVLQVGWATRPMTVPRRTRDVVGMVFEINRRNRYVEELAAVPAGVRVHVLPTGTDGTKLGGGRYRDTSRIGERIAAAYAASVDYLSSVARP